ncbi:hypothetical protein [Azospirillum melinis]
MREYAADPAVFAVRPGSELVGALPDATSTERNPDIFRASLLATTTIPALGMTFQEAADQTRALLAGYPAIPEDDEAGRDAQGSEWQRPHDAVLTAPARTFGDLLAKVERMACPHIGMRTFHLKEAERGMLEQDVERLRFQIIAAGGGDAKILAAFERWANLVQDCCTAETDEDVERLSKQADEAALDVMPHEPTTPEGLAAQVYVMLHLEHGGSAPDHLDIGFLAQSDADHADGAAVHALVERIGRIGRPGREAASQELPPRASRAARSTGPFGLPCRGIVSTNHRSAIPVPRS